MPVPTKKKRFAIFKNSNSNKYPSAMSAMEGKQDVFEEMKAKFWPTFKVSRKKSRLMEASFYFLTLMNGKKITTIYDIVLLHG